MFVMDSIKTDIEMGFDIDKDLLKSIYKKVKFLDSNDLINSYFGHNIYNIDLHKIILIWKNGAKIPLNTIVLRDDDKSESILFTNRNIIISYDDNSKLHFYKVNTIWNFCHNLWDNNYNILEGKYNIYFRLKS